MSFVLRVKDGERMTDLCREFGISRKTGYKIWNRYQAGGVDSLFDESRRPERTPHKTPEPIVELIVGLKKQYPTWGAKKLRDKLRERHAGVRVPAVSTVHEVLRREGLVKARKRRPRATSTYVTGVGVSEGPNQIWSTDYKGQFRLGNRNYCYPLTICDHFSRYFLACEALESTASVPARVVFDAVFREYGLPRVIRSDNGVPFASRGLGGISRLSAWWLKLGIVPERIEPGHPEQNGRHERLHRTLKKETARPSAPTLLQQQERFDAFRVQYNQERPHEAIDLKRPAELYCSSTRPYDGTTPEPSYPLHDLVRRVAHGGSLLLHRTRFQLGRALDGELVGLRELDDGRWLVSFTHVDLGHLDVARGTFHPIQPIRLTPPTTS